jgi:hypothetical protein
MDVASGFSRTTVAPHDMSRHDIVDETNPELVAREIGV